MLPYFSVRLLRFVTPILLAAATLALPQSEFSTATTTATSQPFYINPITGVITPAGIAVVTETATLDARQDDSTATRAIPEYTPIVTPAPDQDEKLRSMGYSQVTYYTCRTREGIEHCGWHIPVVKVAARGARFSVQPGVGWAVVGLWVAVAAVVFG